jgi:uncharacterized membrane protein (UPF0127 family)
MNVPRRILDYLARRRLSATSDMRLRIANLTRQTELAHCVDVADNSAKRRKGLLGRTMLAVGEGMWIVPCEAVHTFGMQFPIDLVYVDRDKRVKKVRCDVPPRRISACLSAHSVLELAAGSIRRTQTKPGDKLEFGLALPPSDRGDSADTDDFTLPEPGETQGMAIPMQQKRLRVVTEFLAVAFCTVAFLLTVGGICSSLLRNDAAGIRDYVTYWAAGQQLVHHANPYDMNAVLGLERSAGFPAGSPALVIRNPPSALLFAVPLGFLGAKAGLLLWSLLLLACLVVSVRMVWGMHGYPKSPLHFLGYAFGPALVCLMVGQASLLVLLGLVLFLRLHQSRPFLAGVSLWLCLLKPHLFLPFGIVLLAWVIVTRSYKLLAGVAVALCFSTGVVLALDPRVWVHYGQMMSAARIDQLPIPCLSILLLRSISPNTIWLQYLPAALSCVWALFYFRRHRDAWGWLAHGSLLMVVSIVVAPYAWIMDHAILIPALLHAAYLTRSRSVVTVLALMSAVVGVWCLRGNVPLQSEFYLWPAPAWLAWYLYAVRDAVPKRVEAYDLPLLANGSRAMR